MDEAHPTHITSRGENFTPSKEKKKSGKKETKHNPINPLYSTYDFSIYCVLSFMSDLFQSSKLSIQLRKTKKSF